MDVELVLKTQLDMDVGFYVNASASVGKHNIKLPFARLFFYFCTFLKRR